MVYDGLRLVCVFGRELNLLFARVRRNQPQRSPGQEDEAEAEEGLFSGRSGQAGVEGHE